MRRRKSNKVLTVDGIIGEQQVSEKELSWSLSRSPMDMLLSPPDSLGDDEVSISESNFESPGSTRTVSAESIPSLGDSFATDGNSSVGTPASLSSLSRRTRFTPMRKSLEPVSSSPGSLDEDHPLAISDLDLEELDFRVFEDSVDESPPAPAFRAFKPFKSAFKSNLTASLRALRSAAKSFSAINFPTIPPSTSDTPRNY